MTDAVTGPGAAPARDAAARQLARRHRAERRFRLFGMAAIMLALAFLALLLASITVRGYSAFAQTHILLEIAFDPAVIDPGGTRDPQELARADYAALIRSALQDRFPEVKKRRDRRQLVRLLSSGARFDLREMVLDDPGIIGTRRPVWLPASDDVDMIVKGVSRRDAPEAERRVKDVQLRWLEALEGDGAVARQFNYRFFERGDSREPELAGLRGAVAGSFFTLVVTLLLSFPVGVTAAIYLEEFAPRNRWTKIIEVNINNLAAVPSIVFGLLGLALFLNVMSLPRSAPLVGGMVLALMTLPTIIIATRAALKAVPPSIRQAAQGLGASAVQVVMHHVLPLAMPGVLTGTIIGMARALGETAPLLMIGMVAFIVDVPQSPTDPATVLPIQIYLWADSPERAFVERTAAATMVLLVFLIAMNGVAVFLRKKFERRW